MLPLLAVLGCSQRAPFYPPDGFGETDTPDTNTAPDTDTPPVDTADTDTGPTPCDGRKIGVQIGDCAHNFVVPDEHGEQRELWDYSGRVIILDLSGFT